MASVSLPPHLKNLLYAQRHRLLEDELGRVIERLIHLGIDDEFTRQELAGRVRHHEIAQAFAGPFMTPGLRKGDIRLGFDQDGNFLRVPIAYLNGHSLTLGNSGAAKTTKTRFLVPQIAPRVRGLWLFDFRKREFAVLRPVLQDMGIELLIVPTRALRFNPVQPPPDTDPRRFAPRAADILVHVLGLPARATKLLHATILRLYGEMDIFAGSQRYPTLFHIRDAVVADKSANPPARQALVDSLDPVLASLGPEVLGYHIGWTTRDLAERHIVFDLSDAAEVEKDLAVNCLLESEFTYRIAHGVSNPVMDLYIACDEAASLVSASQGSSGLTQRMGLIRGTGIGVDLSVQSGDIAQTILSNTANKFLGRCGSARDYDLVGGAIGLNGEQRQWMSTNLRPGLFVAQVAEGQWRHPLVLEIPELHFPSQASIPNEEVGDLARLPLVQANLPGVPAPVGSARKMPALHSAPVQAVTSDAEIRFLDAIAKNPNIPSHRYAKLAGVGPRRAIKLRKNLISRGFLRQHSVNIAARGRAAIVLELLPSAVKLLSTAGLYPAGPTP